MPIQVTEDLIRAVATKDKAISDGRTLVKKGAFKNLSRAADDSLLWGQCQGSGSKPYELSVDLAGDHPIIRCSCPVKPPPCKHTLGLMVAFAEKPAAFNVAPPPAELAEKRAKNLERVEKKAEGKPREVNKAAAEKKTKKQREALDLLEQVVLDLTRNGLAALSVSSSEKLVEQARQFSDAYLLGAAEALRRIATLAKGTASRSEDDEDVYYQLREPGDDLPEELRQRLMLRHLTRLWAMVRRGQKALDEKLEEGESRADSDAVVELLLGRVWQLTELREQGYAQQNLELLELAYERYDDQVREERVEQSWFVALGAGDVLVERSYRPLAALGKTKAKESWEKVLQIAEAGVYPGFVNRRVRWELAAMKTRESTRGDFQRVHQVAQASLDQALGRYKEQIKNPLAPDDAVVLLRAADVRNAGDTLVLLDEKGQRLVLRDSPLARCRSLNNLRMAAGASLDGQRLAQPSSLLVRLFLGIDDDAIYGQPLALMVGGALLRLGM